MKSDSKESKDEAFYGHPPPLGRCIDCIHFEQVSGTEDGAGTSDRVNGIVLPEFGCMNFEMRADLKKIANRNNLITARIVATK